MLNCVICDDEAIMRERLTQYLHRFEWDTGNKFHITAFQSGDELLRTYPRNTDLLLLDIQMEGSSGMDVAKRVREFDRDVCIIFITTMHQMAMEGYKVRAFGFLKKPVTYPEFRYELREAMAQIKGAKKQSIVLKSGTELRKLNADDILYIEVRNHNVEIHSATGTEEFYIQLKELAARLQSHGFFCPHTSYLVNQRHIAKVGKEALTLTDGTVIPISKHRRKEFLTELTNYVGDQI